MLMQFVRKVVIATSKNQIIFKVYCSIYRMIIVLECFLLGHFKEIEKVYLKHGMAYRDIEPGLSDIDMAISIRDMETDEEIKFLRRFWNFIVRVRKILPLIGEIEIFTDEEFSYWRDNGNLEAYESSGWKLLAGKENRKNIKYNESVFKINTINQSFDLFCWQLNDLMFLDRFEEKKFVKTYLKILKAINYFNYNPAELMCVSRKDIFEDLKNREENLFKSLNNIYNTTYDDSLDESVDKCLHFIMARITENIRNLNYMPERNINCRVLNTRKQDTYDYVMDILSRPLLEIQSIEGVKDFYLVSGRLGDSGAIGNYNYKLYIVIDEKFNDMYINILNRIRKIVGKYCYIWPFYYFGLCQYPVILNEEMFKYAVDYWDPMEGIYLDKGRNGECWLPDIIETRTRSYFALSRLHIRGYGINRPVDRFYKLFRFKKKDFAPALTLIDYIFTLFHIDLLLREKLIAFSPRDVLNAYLNRYPHDTFNVWIEKFYEKYSNLKLDDMEAVLDMNRLYIECLPFIKHQQQKIVSELGKT